MSPSLLELETLDGPGGASRDGGRREVVAALLWHPSAARVGARALLSLEAPGATAPLSRSEPLFGDAPLSTPFVSRRPLMVEALADGGLALDARGGGRVEVDGEAIDTLLLPPARVDAGVVVQLGTHVVLLLQREMIEPAPVPAWPRHGEPGEAGEPGEPAEIDELIGASAGMAQLRRGIARTAQRAGAVLVRGETGCGKELVARALHRASPRSGKTFVAVNMAAVPSTLAASQLFGHARGAFSGADRPHDGFFAQADGGTLFLDEIADTAPEVQAALLRALESGEVQPIGAQKVKQVDVRVIAATDGDLETAVAAGRFRAPLFYRLATHEIAVPPLRARRADIGPLLAAFLRAELAAIGREGLLEPAPTEASPWMPAALVASLARCDWPGNVRQLKSLAGVMAGEAAAGHALALDDARWPRPRASKAPEGLPSGRGARVTGEAAALGSAGQPPTPASDARPGRAPREIGDDELEQVLALYDYRLAAAAAHFGISRPSMNQLIDRHPRLRRAQHLAPDEIGAALEREAQGGEAAWRALRVSETGLVRRMEELGLTRTPKRGGDGR